MKTTESISANKHIQSSERELQFFIPVTNEPDSKGGTTDPDVPLPPRN
jgi:hypothetical protein